MSEEEKRAYSKGYAAGRRKASSDRARQIRAAAVRNERLTTLTAAIMAAGMQGGWGEDDDSGRHRNYNLKQLESMAINSAKRMVVRMEVFE